MSDEIPQANPPLTAEEISAVGKLTEADFKIIDAAILANSSEGWLKVARVVSSTADALRNRFPDLSYVFYAQRLRWLVKKGHLKSQGNLAYMRFSEIRIPVKPAKKKNEKRLARLQKTEMNKSPQSGWF